MQQQQHLSVEDILSCLDEPQGHAASLDHLIECAHCRRRADHLGRFSEQLPVAFAGLLPGDGQTQDHSAQQLQQLYQSLQGGTAPAALSWSQRLHFSDHARDMQQALGWETAEKQKQQTARPSLWRRWLVYRLPLWQMAPLAAALVIALVLPMMRVLAPSQPALAWYQEGDYFMEQNSAQSGPGLGFFSQAQTPSAQQATLQVSQRKDSIELRWPQVDGVVQYHLYLQRRQGEGLETVWQQGAEQPVFVIQGALLAPHIHYSWRLQGQRKDGSVVTARGGVVVNE